GTRRVQRRRSRLQLVLGGPQARHATVQARGAASARLQLARHAVQAGLYTRCAAARPAIGAQQGARGGGGQSAGRTRPSKEGGRSEDARGDGGEAPRRSRAEAKGRSRDQGQDGRGGAKGG